MIGPLSFWDLPRLAQAAAVGLMAGSLVLRLWSLWDWWSHRPKED